MKTPVYSYRGEKMMTCKLIISIKSSVCTGWKHESSVRWTIVVMYPFLFGFFSMTGDGDRFLFFFFFSSPSYITIMRDNSVNWHECSPIWVGIFIELYSDTFVSVWYVCALWSSPSMLCEKKTIYFCPQHPISWLFNYINLIEIPTLKGANSCKTK